MAKQKTRGAIELRYHGKTSLLDEIVAKDATIHVEQMSDECFLMSIVSGEECADFHFFLAKQTVTDEDGETFRPIVFKLTEKWKEKVKQPKVSAPR